MKQFSYIITDAEGIHARPAGQLVKIAGSFESDITIEANGKSKNAKKILAVMGLGVKKDMEVAFKIEGEDETKAAIKLEGFMKENL